MKFKEVEMSSMNPFQSEEEKVKFLHVFANFCDYATRVTKTGDVVEENEDCVATYYCPAYFLGWKWHLDLLNKTARGKEYPEREFVDFVFDMSARLGVVPYASSKEKAMEEFEKEMKKVWKHPDTFKIAVTSGEYLSHLTHGAFEAWCAARNYPKFPIRKVEG